MKKKNRKRAQKKNKHLHKKRGEQNPKEKTVEQKIKNFCMKIRHPPQVGGEKTTHTGARAFSFFTSYPRNRCG